MCALRKALRSAINVPSNVAGTQPDIGKGIAPGMYGTADGNGGQPFG